MSVNQLVNKKLDELYELTNIKEILEIKKMDLRSYQTFCSKTVMMTMINNFILAKSIVDYNKYQLINKYVNDIYDLLLL